MDEWHNWFIQPGGTPALRERGILFGRNISKWVGKQTVLPSNVLSMALVGKNKGHPAVFPIDLPLFFIKLLCPPDGLVIDPFAGSGTTGLAALSVNRRCVLIDNNLGYCKIALRRLREEVKTRIEELIPFAAEERLAQGVLFEEKSEYQGISRKLAAQLSKFHAQANRHKTDFRGTARHRISRM